LQYRELAEMYENEVDHWWFAGKRLLFKRMLADRIAAGDLDILDIGCGTGASAVEFGTAGRVIASDRSPDALEFVRTRGLSDVVAANAAEPPFADESFDLVLAFDIIEHVEDDLGMLQGLGRVLKPGGAIAIHVPAWPVLWSDHDEILEHKRRYTRDSLSELVDNAGLRFERLSWSSMTILPVAFAMRGLRRFMPKKNTAEADMFSLPPLLNAAAFSVYRAEAAMAARFNLPFGLSLAAVVVR
jgi:SAM-dependent methyltransferase